LKQSVRHLIIIAGTLMLVFGLLTFSYSIKLVESDVYALSSILAGLYMIMRMLQNTHQVKVRQVDIVGMLEKREADKNDSSPKQEQA